MISTALFRKLIPQPSPRTETLCVLPFIHFNIQANGDATPCCVSLEPLRSRLGKPLNVRTHSLAEIWGSAALRDVRKKMLAGEQPKHCACCYNYEKTGFRSHRMEQNQLFLDGGPGAQPGPKADIKALTERPGKPWYFDLRFDNVCQLKCVICFGYASSQIERDPVHMKWTGEKPIQRMPNRFKAENWVSEPALFDELKDIGSEVRFIQLAGGEPFLSRLAMDWLKHLGETGRARQVAIKVFTNLQRFDDAVIKLLAPFQRLDMTLSIDGTGPVYEYVRFPGKWRTIERNISRLAEEMKGGRLQNATANINVTMSAHSALKVTEVFDVAKAHGFYCTLNNAVEPPHTAARFLPEETKNRLEKKLREYAAENPGFKQLPGQIDQWMAEIKSVNSESPEQRGRVVELMRFTNDIDKSRGLSLRSVMPEIHADFVRAFGVWDERTRYA